MVALVALVTPGHAPTITIVTIATNATNDSHFILFSTLYYFGLLESHRISNEWWHWWHW